MSGLQLRGSHSMSEKMLPCRPWVMGSASWVVWVDPNFLANFPRYKSLDLSLMISGIALI